MTIAREVLERDGGDIAAAMVARPGGDAQALARAVLRVKEMAEALEVGALWAINHPDLDDDLKDHARVDREYATEILKALNGETR